MQLRRRASPTIWVTGFSWRQPQKPGQLLPPSKPISDLVRDRLKNPKCAEYVQKLLDKANELFGQGYLHAKSMDELLRKIDGAGGFQLDGAVYHTGSGDLFANGALPGTVHIIPFMTPGAPQASPLGTTQRRVSSSGSNTRIEIDPVGALVRLNPNSPLDHSGSSGDIPTGGSGSLDGRFSSMANPLSGCTLDGVFMPCSLALRGEGESSYVESVDPFVPVTYRGRRRKPVWVHTDTSWSVRTGDNELTVYSGPGGHFEWVDDPDEVLELFTQSATTPQNTGFKTGGPAFSDQQKKILAESSARINENDCRNFINETLAKYKVGEQFNSLDKLLNNATFGYYDVNADYTNTDLGVDFIAQSC